MSAQLSDHSRRRTGTDRPGSWRECGRVEENLRELGALYEVPTSNVNRVPPRLNAKTLSFVPPPLPQQSLSNGIPRLPQKDPTLGIREDIKENQHAFPWHPAGQATSSDSRNTVSGPRETNLLTYNPNVWTNGEIAETAAARPFAHGDFLNEPPLLDELGIHPDHIAERMQAVLLFHNLDEDLLTDTDMCGPCIFATLLGVCLLLVGKVHFAYIYGISVTGSLSCFILLNLLSQDGYSIDLYRTVSVLGYGLGPLVLIAFLAVFVSLRRRILIGFLAAAITVCWSTATVSRFFEMALRMRHQRFLVAYPVALLYAAFVLITVF